MSLTSGKHLEVSVWVGESVNESVERGHLAEYVELEGLGDMTKISYPDIGHFIS